ncbi:MAG: hypothetical protein JNM27_19820 [Leptospirales bacterium]|nr:hypothetical protein [Leptospirales bacterium]
MQTMKSCIISILILASAHLHALGTYSEGWAIIVPTKLEQSGILFNSYEGMLDIVHYDRNESCDEANDACYTPKSKSIPFSIDDTSTKLINFVQKNLNREMIINYRIHRVKAMDLSSDFEITQAFALAQAVPENFQRQVTVDKTGKKRSFSVFGKILMLEYRGRAVGSWEGIYYDKQKDRVHPFSITNETIAKQVLEVMKIKNPYYFGVTVAYVTGIRDSAYDIFEINLDGPAGAPKPSGEPDKTVPAKAEPTDADKPKTDQKTEPIKETPKEPSKSEPAKEQKA